MGKLVVAAFVSLDGVMQAPGGPEEDPEGGFPYGGWQFPFADDDMGRIVVSSLTTSQALLLGRRTYDIFAGYWPQVTDPDDPIASALNDVPKYVVSTTLTEPEWHNTTVISSDVPDAVRAVKDRYPGAIYTQGSTRLLPTLFENDLVDELMIGVFPVVLGRGKKLFADGIPGRSFRLRESQRTSTGAIFSTYEKAGEVETGSF